MSESFAELFEESVKNLEMRPGMIVKGHVLEIGPDMVVVHAGLKSEGVVPIAEFKDLNGEVEVQVGDEVEVAVDAFEDGFGETKLSREKAKRARAWEDLEKIQNADEIVTGIITGKVKGGFVVDLDGDVVVDGAVMVFAACLLQAKQKLIMPP